MSNNTYQVRKLYQLFSALPFPSYSEPSKQELSEAYRQPQASTRQRPTKRPMNNRFVSPNYVQNLEPLKIRVSVFGWVGHP